MPQWISGSYQISTSGSFEITRPKQIPLHTWTSSFDGINTMKGDFNSGKWERITPYFTLFSASATADTDPDDFDTYNLTPQYPSQSHVDRWAEDLSNVSGINLSGSLEDDVVNRW